MAKASTGDGVDYDDAEAAAAEAAAERAFEDYYGHDGYYTGDRGGSAEPREWDDGESSGPDEDGGGVVGGGGGGASSAPSRLHVTARIEWAGVESGTRTTTLDGLNLAPVVAARDRVVRAERRSRRERGASGWSAQLRELTGSARGSAAADRAGLDVTRQTLTRWLTESQAPSRANRDRIATAYAELRGDRAERASRDVREARNGFARSLTRAARDRYGANVRSRDIEDFRFLD